MNKKFQIMIFMVLFATPAIARYEHEIVQKDDKINLSEFDGNNQINLKVPEGWYQNNMMMHYGYHVVPTQPMKHKKGWAHEFLVFLSRKKSLQKNFYRFEDDEFAKTDEPYIYLLDQTYGFYPEAKDMSYLDETVQKGFSRIRNENKLGTRESLKVDGLDCIVREYEFEKFQHLAPYIFRYSDKYVPKGQVKMALGIIGFPSERMLVFGFLAPLDKYEIYYPVFKQFLESVDLINYEDDAQTPPSYRRKREPHP